MREKSSVVSSVRKCSAAARAHATAFGVFGQGTKAGSFGKELRPGSSGRRAAARGGELGAVRTHDPRLKRALLYQLSYELA
jgi:hypothetical protein